MTQELETRMQDLTEIQRHAVDWNVGSVLVLAGPGSGKTRVLTTRIAKLLEDSQDGLFRILALTFTNRAADEMKRRVEALTTVPQGRVFIGTFHSFCAQQLRQHGSHIGIKSDYGVYGDWEDRKALFRDALRQVQPVGTSVYESDVDNLKKIDRYRSTLRRPPAANQRLRFLYDLYEQALKDNNVLDFDSLILKMWELCHARPSLCKRLRRVYRYWLVDEFQDMSRSQYEILRVLAGDKFRNLFAVADEDQMIYSWRGASQEGLQEFRTEFNATTLYFQENFRCPAGVVQLANRLISRNSQRDTGRPKSISTKSTESASVRWRRYPNDIAEARSVADYFLKLSPTERERGGVLARNRRVLGVVLNGFRSRNVKAVMIRGHREFVSPQIRWLESCIELSVRPYDRQRLRKLVVDSQRFVHGLELDPDDLISRAEADHASYLETWARFTQVHDDDVASRLGDLALELVESRREWKRIIHSAIETLEATEHRNNGSISDMREDLEIWQGDTKQVLGEYGTNIDLSQFSQIMALRTHTQRVPKETVRLATIHAAKGLQFERVWIVGVAEEILPSYQTIQSGSRKMMEEERRNMFVAITRTTGELTLSMAALQDNRWSRVPSRFVAEMRRSR